MLHVDLEERFQKILFADEVATHWTSPTNPEKVFVLLQAKPGKGGGGGGSNTAVQGPEDVTPELHSTRNWWTRRSFVEACTSSTSSPQEFHTSNTSG